MVMNPDNMTEDEILDLDHAALRHDLQARLRALKYNAYLRTVLRILTELRNLHSDELAGQGERLVDGTIELVTAFVEGRADLAAATKLDHAWIDYTHFDPDDEDPRRSRPTWTTGWRGRASVRRGSCPVRAMQHRRRHRASRIHIHRLGNTRRKHPDVA
jgi:hypothetical protein